MHRAASRARRVGSRPPDPHPLPLRAYPGRDHREGDPSGAEAVIDRVLALEPGRTALLVVDMQHGFLDPGEAMEVAPARVCVPVIRALLETFRAQRLPVVF